MARPQRYLTRMMLFLVAVLAVAGLLFLPLRAAFLANAPLNGLILAVFAAGIVYVFRQVILLGPEVAWIESFRQNRPAVSSDRPPRLLAPMATMLGERKDRLSLSATAMRSLLDGISSRLEESRDITRYLIGLLIFLGLLGTFWGLMQAVGSVGTVIGGLTAGGDAVAAFGDLKRGLEVPLGGMGTAFSTSLFGLAGSLVLGFLDLQAGQAQNRFFNELEEWLSSLTRLSSGVLPGDGEQAVPAYVQALLEQTAEHLENLQRTLARGEENRIATNTSINALIERLGTLTDQMRTELTLMTRLAEGQAEMKPILAKLAEGVRQQGGLDEATRTHIRNLDLYMARLLEETTQGREELIQQLRSEIKLLARTIAAVGDETGR
jgi:hypothetical protein